MNGSRLKTDKNKCITNIVMQYSTLVFLMQSSVYSMVTGMTIFRRSTLVLNEKTFSLYKPVLHKLSV